jgi:hypothetical protein
MLKPEEVAVGVKVRYEPSYYSESEADNGMIKEVPPHSNDSVRVVYHCNGNWHKLENYTSALTNLRDLKLGWKVGELK